MSLRLFDPVVYGDNSALLGRHLRATDDVLNFSGDIPTRTVVGDVRDLAAHARGGNDSITNFASGGASAIGDALTITNHAVGGDDFVKAGASGEAYASGDALTLSGHAHGGNDTVVAQSDFGATAYGDAVTMTDHATGGNDALTGWNGHGAVTLIGDAETLSDHSHGGNDTLTGQNGYTAEMYGDGKVLSGFSRGGDDVLVGGSHVVAGAPHTGPNQMYGDGLSLTDRAIGGDDTLVSGQGSDDHMWGDAAFVGARAQTGADVFVFSAQNGRDRIMDFEPGKDMIELHGTGFSSFQDVVGLMRATADGIEITFDANNTILVHGVVHLGSQDFLFA